ncbi:uncharacterized protein LOC115398336 isoform X2 [Salarias fasciatus]|uniref:uncharacterized protein LOC115398336 isoform X2 n=1 Tax=Salarias fasciatus TaxID=181472 RepID=UPI0011769F01|nr:uncharacterized protein LOC115398336 isoform X2 [Salarias fasciatus]
MNPDRDFQAMRKHERAHFFSSKEQDLILRLYEEEREILTAKSNTTSASKLREEAWQRIADRINEVSDSGYKRTWQQVKVKHKNIMQTAKRRRAEMMRNMSESATPSLTSAEEDMLLHEDKLRLDILPVAPGIDQISGSDNSFMDAPGHPVLFLPPVTKTEPESLSSDETDVSETNFEIDMSNSGFQEKPDSARPAAGGKSAAKHTEDVRELYCSYLKKEMENRDQEMAYRALKMRKVEKEILLLDKQLM